MQKPACVYVNTGMSMFILLVTVTVYTLVDCQLVNMGIVYFGESIKKERDWGSLVGSVWGGQGNKIKPSTERKGQ